MTWCDKQYPKEADERQKIIDQPYMEIVEMITIMEIVEIITMIMQWIGSPSVDRSAIWFVSTAGALVVVTV